MLNIDYNLNTPQQRNELVERIIAETPQQKLTPRYLKFLSDYILSAINKKEKHEKLILTDNRMVTINKRQTSYEGLVGKLKNGENGIYNMTSDLGKTAFLSPKNQITSNDIVDIPGLQEIRDTIEKLEEQYKRAYGRRRYLLKKQIIQMRQDQYVLRNKWQKPAHSLSSVRTPPRFIIEENITFNERGLPQDNSNLSFFNPTHIAAILSNYMLLKRDIIQSPITSPRDDSWSFMQDFDTLVQTALADSPLYYDILSAKINGFQNLEIQQQILKKYNINYTIQYISTLWQNKIPKLIAAAAQQQYLVWYYTTQQRGTWKKCSKCGEVKLAHNLFFSHNKSSKDGWYSICKVCRNAKKKEAAAHG